jgi:hypothetical protein
LTVIGAFAVFGATTCSMAEPTARPRKTVMEKAEPGPPETLAGGSPAAPREQSATMDAAQSAVPQGLLCLSRHYGGSPRVVSGSYFLEFIDGPSIPWNDGREKSAQERLDAPDLEDTLIVTYRQGAIESVVSDEQDPGRARNEALFKQVYGNGERAVRAALVPWTFGGREYQVHRLAEPAFRAVGQRLQSLLAQRPELKAWLDELGGTFSYRRVAGTERLSPHAFGTAVDLNPKRTEYWRNDAKGAPWRNRVPQALVDAFEAEGFIWGGRWRHFDTMHFEYRPELLDPQCRVLAAAPADGQGKQVSPTHPVQYPWLEPGAPARASLEQTFAPPQGYRRVPLDGGSFGSFVRSLPLLPAGSPVRSHRGDTILAGTDPRLAAVVDLDVGEADLQQCADTVIRLHAEWAFGRGDEAIAYRAGDGTRLDFVGYLRGDRISARDGRLGVTRSGVPRARTHEALRQFLNGVFNWVNTGALARFSRKVELDEIAPGDFFVVSGSPFGHAVIVLDVARDEPGQTRLLLGQGFMPAQSLHVLRPAADAVWFPLDQQSLEIKTPFWSPFPFTSLRRL